MPRNVVIENVLPRSSYDVDETGYWKRLPWVVGGFFGLAMALWSVVFPVDDSNLLMPRYRRVLSSLFLGGGLFGLAFPLFVKRRWRRFNDGLYNQEEWIDVPPQDGQQFYYRLPASLSKSSRSAVGGVLYLGRPGFLFVPHKKNVSKHEPLQFGPVETINIKTIDPLPQTFIQKLLMPHPQKLLEIRSPGESGHFIVPTVEHTATKLSQLVNVLREAERGTSRE